MKRILVFLGLLTVLVVAGLYPSFAFFYVTAQEAPVLVEMAWTNIGSSILPPWDLYTHSILSGSVQYTQPTDDCATTNEPRVSCSDEGSFPYTQFQVEPFELFMLHGDMSEVLRDAAVTTMVVEVPEQSLAQRLWLVYNADDEPISVYAEADFDSARTWYKVPPFAEYVHHVLMLGFERVFAPPQLTTEFAGDKGQPTPDPNCDSSNGCNRENIMMAVWYAGQWYELTGVYDEGFFGMWSWTESTNTLSQLDGLLPYMRDQLYAPPPEATAEATLEG